MNSDSSVRSISTRAGTLELIGAIAVGGLLLFAASMKLFNSGEGATLGVGTIAIVAIEVLFAGALIAMRGRWWAWASAATMFGAFAGFAGFRAYWGDTSCGCFGAFAVAPKITMSMDLFIVAVATAFATRRALGASPAGLIATAAAAFALLGSGVGFAIADPRPEDFGDDATRLLLELPSMAEVASRDADGPAWFLYIFNPECPICIEHLPRMREREQAWAESDVLRLYAISMFELEQYEGIPMYAWGTPPLTLLIERGIVTHRASGLDMLDPDSIKAEFEATP